MARTTHNWVTQGTLGIVPEAELPTDPVPLSQASGGNFSYIVKMVKDTTAATNFWFDFFGNKSNDRFGAEIPGPLRVKSVKVTGAAFSFSIWRNGTLVAAVAANSQRKLDLLFKAHSHFAMTFGNPTVRYTAHAFFEIEPLWFESIEDVQPAPAPEPGGAPADLIPNITILNPENQDIPEIVERPGNRWISWIRRKWR